MRLGDDRLAIVHLERAAALKPELHAAHANLLDAYLGACDWSAVERCRAGLRRLPRTHGPAQWAQRVHPRSAMMLFGPEVTRPLAVQRARIAAVAAGAVTRSRARYGLAVTAAYAWATCRRISITTRWVIPRMGCTEAHDRARFEIYAYSTAAGDEGRCHTHIRETCDHFIDASHQAAGSIRSRIEADGIDILVDMNGYTAGSRRDVFALRPAAVQVNYLGYPGTSGAEYMDYFVTDPIATPPGLEDEFTEKLVYLPGSYQANHREALVAREIPPRERYGLPDEGLVFCCFNAVRKIDPVVFASWMDILKAAAASRAVDGQGRTGRTGENLQRAAAAHGVDPARPLFAPQEEEERLSRASRPRRSLSRHVCGYPTRIRVAATRCGWPCPRSPPVAGDGSAARVEGQPVHACGCLKGNGSRHACSRRPRSRSPGSQSRCVRSPRTLRASACTARSSTSPATRAISKRRIAACTR